MQRFEGDREIARPVSEVGEKLNDVAFLVSCLPDVESVRSVEEDRAELVLRPGFSFVRGALELTLRRVERAEGQVRLQFLGKGIGSASEVEATLRLDPDGETTRIHWTAEVKSLGGLLKLVPAGLIRGAAEKIINDAWNRVVERLG